MASYRYRCQIPGEQLEKHGHTVAYNGGEAHICVFSKPVMDDLTVSKVARANGCKIVVDIGDNHFAHREFGPIYGKMLQIADYIVTPTPAMREVIHEFTDKEIHVIPDPYEFDARPPHASEGDKRLWFGHNVNLHTMEPYLGLHDLTVVTGPKVQENWVLWSKESLTKAFEEHHLALFPTHQGHYHKSANRVINAINAGLSRS